MGLPYTEIILARDVRNFVLIPLTLAAFLMGMIRHYIAQAFLKDKPIDKVDEKMLRELQIVRRAETFKQMGYWLSPKAFAARKAMFLSKENGGYLHESTIKRPDAATQMMSGDPSFLTGMMARNMQNLVPQVLMFGFVNTFFTGFVMGKVPFPLTHKFKSMLQGGMDLPYLDVTYISSLSYFFLLMFGSSKIMSLILREEVEAMSAMSMNPMMGMMGGGATGGAASAAGSASQSQARLQSQQLQAAATQSKTMDTGKAFTALQKVIEQTEHDWALTNVETSCTALLKKAYDL